MLGKLFIFQTGSNSGTGVSISFCKRKGKYLSEQKDDIDEDNDGDDDDNDDNDNDDDNVNDDNVDVDNDDNNNDDNIYNVNNVAQSRLECNFHLIKMEQT